jgi:hypothetical protein
MSVLYYGLGLQDTLGGQRTTSPLFAMLRPVSLEELCKYHCLASSDAFYMDSNTVKNVLADPDPQSFLLFSKVVHIIFHCHR